MVIVNWMDDNNVPTSYEAAAEAIAGNNFTVCTLIFYKNQKILS